MIDEKIILKYTAFDAPKHRYYKESVAIEEALKPHSEGIYPVKLIDTARPNEPTIYKDYRREVFEPITKTYYDKVLNLLGKIQMADDWAVKWPEPKATFAEGESPKEYLQENYPDFKSLENWFFSVGLNSMIDDPNSVVCIYPEVVNLPDNVYRKPICHIYSSEEVLEFKNQELCVIKICEVPENDLILLSEYQLPEENDRSVLIFCDRNTVEKYVKVKDGDAQKYVQYYIYEHNSNLLPCVKMGGRIKEYKYGEKLYESFIQSCLPHWNEAVRRYSDHQVNMSLHLHPDRWEIADAPCKVCSSNGTLNRTIDGKVEKTPCKACGGAGRVAVKTPFGVKLIGAEVKTGPDKSTSIPTPPMGYAERPIETIDYLNKEWKSDIQQGLSSLNMEFLMYEPAVNSGIAKALDRGELNAYIYSIANHVIENDLQPFVYIILKQRYGLLINDSKLKEMMPSIKVPVKYDIILSTVLLEVAKNAKDSGIQGSVLDQMYLEYAGKEFGKDSLAYNQVINRIALDPLPHMSVDEKMLTFSNRGCTEEQYVISSQLDSFLVRAFEENKEFESLDLKAKRAILSAYAQEVIQQNKNQLLPLFEEPATPQTTF